MEFECLVFEQHILEFIFIICPLKYQETCTSLNAVSLNGYEIKS